MYEVEIKIELTEKERKDLVLALQKQGFVSKGITPQNDYYIEAKESPFTGFDLKRYRNEAGKYIYTEKIWELIDNLPFRKENEHEVTKKEFEAKIAEFPKALKIVKNRDWYKGSYQGIEISVTIDSVKFDHAVDVRHFIEAEIDIAEKKEVPKTKEFIRGFLKELFNKQEIVEAPGMFTMAFKQL